MAQYFSIHPENPQLRLIHRAVDIIRSGGVIAYPTDSSYAIGCRLESKSALNRICAIRQLSDKHNFTLMCKDLAQVSSLGRMENDAFRLIKMLTPGPFTFVLKASKEVPRQLQHTKSKTIGVRIPDHRVAEELLNEFNEPLFSSTLILPGDQSSITDPQEIRERLEKKVDLVIDSGVINYAPTTIIAFPEGNPEIIRQGKGVTALLGIS